MLTYGLTRLDLTLLALDSVHPGFPTLPRSFCRLGASLLVYGMTLLGLLTPALDYVRLGYLHVYGGLLTDTGMAPCRTNHQVMIRISFSFILSSSNYLGIATSRFVL